MKDFWTSVSAFQEAKGKDGRGGCLRRWAFKRFFKLPVPPKEATAFGDVVHAVLARFYAADDRGLVKGKPVELYPPGWKVVPDRFGRDVKDDFIKPELTVLEESLIKTLVSKAIDDGILIRTPGRLVEQPFPNTVLYKHLTTPVAMVLKGFIDLETPTSVEDHKTVKRKKDGSSYALSLNALKTDAQMLIYAKIKYNKGHTGPLWLIHNNFIKDPANPEVLRREIIVEKPYVEDFYNRILLPGFCEMFDIYLKYHPKKDLNKWREIPGPADPNTECNHYYGGKCPFSCICAETTEVGAYLNIYKELVQQSTEQNQQNTGSINLPNNSIQSKGCINMNLLERVRAGNTAVTQQAMPATPAASPQTMQPPVIQQPAAQSPAPPAGGIAAVLANVKAKALQMTGMAPPVTPPAPPVSPVSQPAPPAGPAPTSGQQPAPWYQPGCVACSTNEYPGFNSQCQPCQVCENIASLAGKPTSQMYDYACDAEGKISFSVKAEYAAQIQQPAPPPPPPPLRPQMPGNMPQPQTTVPQTAAQQPVDEIKPKRGRRSRTQVDTQSPAPQTTPQTIQPPAAAQPPQEEPLQSTGKTTEADVQGFDIFIGVTYAKGFGEHGNVVSADDLVRESLAYLTQVGGKDVATLDHFAVMSALDVYIPTIAEALISAGSIVISVQPTKGTALARLLDGLRPFARTVLVAMGV